MQANNITGLRPKGDVSNYITRYCGIEENCSPILSYLGKTERYTLVDFVEGKTECTANKFILYSSAQLGKTTELKHAAWMLQQDGYVVYRYEVREHVNLNVSELPTSHKENGRDVVVIIDALDEVNGKEHNDLLRTICGYANLHDEMRIILSCRSNFRKDDKLDSFTPIYLYELTWEDAKAHIIKHLGDSIAFYKSVNENHLGDFVRNPFFLNVLIDSFAKDGILPSSRTGIYNLFIQNCLNKEFKEKNIKAPYKNTRNQIIGTLQRIALAIQLLGKQSISEDDLLTCIGEDQETLEECLRIEIIEKDKNDRYTFVHNVFREYMVALYLHDKNPKLMEYYASLPNGWVKPEWYNTIMLWLEMYGEKDKEVIDRAIKWLLRSNQELVSYIDKNFVDVSVRNSVFKGTLLKYKSLGIRMASILSDDYQNMMKFAQSEESVAFIIEEFNDEESSATYKLDLVCLCIFLDWNTVSDDQKHVLENILFERMTIAVKGDKTSDLGFVVLENKHFETETYVQKVFNIVKDCTHPEAIKAFANLAYRTDVIDHYVDFLLNKEKHVKNIREGITTHVISKDMLYYSMSFVKTLENAIKILKHEFTDTHGGTCIDDSQMYAELIKKMLDILVEAYHDGREEARSVIKEVFLKKFYRLRYGVADSEGNQRILDIFRNAYSKISENGCDYNNFLAEINEMHERKDIFDDKNTSVFVLTGLWMSIENIKALYRTLDPESEHDTCVSNQMAISPWREGRLLTSDLHSTVFPKSDYQLAIERREKKWIQELSDYSSFRNVVEKVATSIIDKTRREIREMKFEDEEKINKYALSFIYDFERDDKTYDVDAILSSIQNPEDYDLLVLDEISEKIVSDCREKQYIDEELEARCIATAKRVVEELADSKVVLVQQWQLKAIKLLLHKKFVVDILCLKKLIRYSNVEITRKGDLNYNTSYSLFDYIQETITDKEELSRLIVQTLNNDYSNLTYYCKSRFFEFILSNHVNEGYDFYLDRLKGNSDFCFNSIADAVKDEIIRKQIICDISAFSEDVKVQFCVELIRNSLYIDWVKDLLRKEYHTYDMPNEKQALKVLLSLGDKEALQFILANDDYLDEYREFNYNYKNIEDLDSILELLRLFRRKRYYDSFVITSIIGSLESMALSNSENLKKVKSAVGDLINEDEHFSYLNRYLIGFENKFYAEGAQDYTIVVVLKMIDEPELPQHEEVNMESVYITYNWEDASNNMVDLFCSALEFNGINYVRDKKDCHYNVNIKQFMDAIREGKIVVVVFSKPYFKSKNCMYELSGVMTHDNYADRLLPIVVDTKVRSIEYYISVCSHWRKQIAKLENAIRKLASSDDNLDAPLVEQLEELKQIREFLPRIKSYVDWQNALSLNDLQDSQFAPIIQEIKKKQKLVAS